MILTNPAWLSAGAELAIAAETGVAVFSKKANDEVPAAPAPAPTAAVSAVSLDALLMFAGLVALAMAILASAVIVHHGLTA
jgi:hypothetical protein